MKAEKQNRILATLIRGESYALRTSSGDALVFRRGEPRQVSEAQREHLQAHAVDYVSLPPHSDEEEFENRRYPKFVFKEAKDDQAAD